MEKNKGFNLVELIIIIVITAVVSIIATGVIMLKGNSKDLNLVNEDENLKEFIDVYNTILTKYYSKDIDKNGLLNAAEEGMLNFLGDKYTTYLEDTEYENILDELSENYVGIGVGISGNTIVTITPGSPADKAGIQVGDQITRIERIQVDENDSSKIKAYIKDKDINIVELEITRDGVAKEYNLTKEKVNNKVVSSKIIDGTSLGYIYISKFAISLDEQVRKELDQLEKSNITGLIIDLRDDVGGYLTAAEKTASLFLKEGEKIYSLQTSDNEISYKDKTKEYKSYPIVVLINNNTASAAEILASALKESYNASLVGTQSFGKGKVQEVEGLSNGDSVKLTTAKWLTPNGNCIDGIGISPDFIIDGREQQLNKALEILNSSLS